MRRWFGKICVRGALALCLMGAGPVGAQTLILDTERLAPGNLFIAVLQEAFADSGLDVDYRARPWARCFEEARAGNVDGLFALYHSPEREHDFLFTREPLFVSDEQIFVRKGQGFDGAGWRDRLRGKRIGIQNGSYHGPHYEDALARHLFASVESVNNPDNLVAMLLAGRIDAAILPAIQLREALAALPEAGEIEAIEPAFDTLPVYLAFTRKRDFSAVRDRFDEALRRMKADGRYGALTQGYHP